MRDKVIILTGASAGIGRATAVYLVAQGARVALVARREERLQQLAEELNRPEQLLLFAGDMQDRTLPERLVAQVVARWGRIDVLINNAGVGHNDPLATMPLDDVMQLFQTNVIGLLGLTQAVIPMMKEQGEGQIINISSIVGQRPMLNNGAYTASKTAVNFLSRTLRMELAKDGIVVSIVYPGLTSTDFPTAVLGKPRDATRHKQFGTAPEKVARRIGQTIEQQKLEVYVQWYDWLFTHGNRLFPRVGDWIFQQPKMQNK